MNEERRELATTNGTSDIHSPNGHQNHYSDFKNTQSDDINPYICRLYGLIMTPIFLYFFWIGTKIYIVAYHHVDVSCVHHHFAKIRVKVRVVVLYNIDIKKSISCVNTSSPIDCFGL
jgi:hypothetical protein